MDNFLEIIQTFITQQCENIITNQEFVDVLKTLIVVGGIWAGFKMLGRHTAKYTKQSRSQQSYSPSCFKRQKLR